MWKTISYTKIHFKYIKDKYKSSTSELQNKIYENIFYDTRLGKREKYNQQKEQQIILHILKYKVFCRTKISILDKT